jgi:hypothetical protein
MNWEDIKPGDWYILDRSFSNELREFHLYRVIKPFDKDFATPYLTKDMKEGEELWGVELVSIIDEKLEIVTPNKEDTRIKVFARMAMIDGDLILSGECTVENIRDMIRLSTIK